MRRSSRHVGAGAGSVPDDTERCTPEKSRMSVGETRPEATNTVPALVKVHVVSRKP